MLALAPLCSLSPGQLAFELASSREPITMHCRDGTLKVAYETIEICDACLTSGLTRIHAGESFADPARGSTDDGPAQKLLNSWTDEVRAFMRAVAEKGCLQWYEDAVGFKYGEDPDDEFDREQDAKAQAEADEMKVDETDWRAAVAAPIEGSGDDDY